MRYPTFPNIVRTFYAFSNVTSRGFAISHRIPASFARGLALRSMPMIPLLGSFFSTSNSSKDMSFPVNKSDDEWQAVLNKGKPNSLMEYHSKEDDANFTNVEQFRILREKGTEAPYTGTYDKHMPSAGVYTCAGCDAPLYKATHKFKSGCGWPAYFDSIPGAVTRHTDSTFGMARTEIVCSNCGGHLGHVFKGEGYPTPTDERHCVNSISLTFKGNDAEAAPKV